MTVEITKTALAEEGNQLKSWIAPKLDTVEMHATSGTTVFVQQPECVVPAVGDITLDPGNPLCALS